MSHVPEGCRTDVVDDDGRERKAVIISVIRLAFFCRSERKISPLTESLSGSRRTITKNTHNQEQETQELGARIQAAGSVGAKNRKD